MGAGESRHRVGWCRVTGPAANARKSPDESPTKLAARLGLERRSNGSAVSFEELLDLAVEAYWQRRKTREAA